MHLIFHKPRENRMTENADKRPTVLVLGGGYGGINAAKALDDVAT